MSDTEQVTNDHRFPELTLGDRLRIVREKLVTPHANQWADRIEVNRATVANYEKDKYRPSHLYLIALSQASGVSIEEILGPFANNPDGEQGSEQEVSSTKWYEVGCGPDDLISLSALERLAG